MNSYNNKSESQINYTKQKMTRKKHVNTMILNNSLENANSYTVAESLSGVA